MNAPAEQQVRFVQLTQRREEADQTLTFLFEKPPQWRFKAGQYIDVILMPQLLADPGGSSRTFSIASAPHEATIMVTTRLRGSGFKQALATAPLGTPVGIAGPYGNFTLHNDARRPAVLLAGGIGITPFRSMVVDAMHRQLLHRIFLVYSNRRPEEAAFLDELQALQRRNARFAVIATMTGEIGSQQQWNGQRGPIDQDLLGRSLEGIRSAIYYIAGPPSMVSAVHDVLNGMRVDDDDIRQEEFSGY